MVIQRLNWAAIGPTALFVLLWSAGAIFSKWGLEHASAFAFLLLRFVLACAALGLLALTRRRWLPARGTRKQVALVGVLLTGGYTIFYLLSLDAGLTPGVLATVLGVQPILTLMLVERRANLLRLMGLLLALGGLTLVVLDSLLAARFSLLGIGLSLAALLCITLGSIFQKGIQQSPMDVLPLQYAIGLLMCAVVAPFQPFEVEWSVGFIVPLLYMGVLISVGDPVAVPADPHGQSGQRHQPVSLDAWLHRAAGFPVPGESYGGVESAGDGGDCAGVGVGV